MVELVIGDGLPDALVVVLEEARQVSFVQHLGGPARDKQTLVVS